MFRRLSLKNFPSRPQVLIKIHAESPRRIVPIIQTQIQIFHRGFELGVGVGFVVAFHLGEEPAHLERVFEHILETLVINIQGH